MIHTVSKRVRLYFLVLVQVVFLGTAAQSQNDSTWQAGVAKVVITPEDNMWMAGFAVRDHESEGTLHDLWAKALAIEDASGNRAVLVTTDLLGFPKGLSDRIRERVAKQFKITTAQILLNSSHTHSAPVLTDALLDIYPMNQEQFKKVQAYTAELEDQIVALVGKAVQSMKPARLYSENGVTRFQVNRRNNPAATLTERTDLNGPNDYAVPVIKVVGTDGKMMAVAFGYACHNTVLSIYQWSGDYAGFAQLELEKLYPGTTALFFQGAGADQNPLPRGTVSLAQQYGRTLAAAVDRVLQEKMQPLASTLNTAYKEVDLALGKHPDEAGYKKISAETTGYQKRWADRMAKALDEGEPLPQSYPFPLQVWKIGDQVLMGLGGELVIEYAIELKRIFGQDIFVLGYSNDVMSYIPTTTILREGGYEGHTAQRVYGLPSTWASDIESVIFYEMIRLAEKAGVAKIDEH